MWQAHCEYLASCHCRQVLERNYASRIQSRLMVAAIDQFTEHTGRMISWLTLLLVSVVCTVVVLRYLPNIGSILTPPFGKVYN